ncbi:MAG: sensor histidine kinase [Planctomycetota bacterium]|jgi:PAS domain S-box-containing protein
MPEEVNPSIRLRYKLVIIITATIIAEIFALNYLYQNSFNEFHKLQKITAGKIAADINKATATSNIMGGAEILGISNKRIRDVLLGVSTPGNAEVTKAIENSRYKYRASIVYVMNIKGEVVASTTYGNNKTLLGNNYAFRPYFVEAVKGKKVVYPALGVTTKVRGIYLSAPVYDTRDKILQKCIGVIVFKTNLLRVDTLLSQQHNPAALVSPQGIIFSSNIYDWLFKSTTVITENDIKPLRANRQFADLYVDTFPQPVSFEEKENFIEYEGEKYHPISSRVAITDAFGQWKILYLAGADNWVQLELMAAAFLVILISGAGFSLYALLSTRHKVEQIERLKLAEQSEQNIRSIFEAVNDLIIVYDIDSSKVVNANEKACSFFGIKPGTASTVENFDFGAKVNGYTAEEFRKLAELSKHGEEQNFEWPVLNTEKKTRWVDVNLKTADLGNCERMIAVMIDITERKKMENSIRNINVELEKRVHDRTAQLEAANEELEAFSYSVSHDLRSPLVSIGGFSQVLEDEYGKELNDEALSFIHRIKNAGKRMENIIDDILVLSRLTKGEFNRTEIDLSAMAKTVYLQIREQDRKRAIEINIAENMVAFGDSRLLQIALENLIGNAWKFTSKKPITIIEIGMRIIADEKVFFIKDNGAGFNEEQADRLFIPFERLHSKVEFDGSGIGLTTVKRIIKRHSGRIWAKGEPDIGAEFYFTLPDN